MTAAAAPEPRDVTVLVPAAGGGERLGLGPKALLPLHGRPVAEWVVRKAMQIADEVIVACPPGSQPVFDAACRWSRIDGGPTRQQSVRLLARAATRPWVVVWDAARPFTSIVLARAVLAAAGPAGAAAAMLPDGSFQTPLAFGREVLLGVTEQAQHGAWVGTSTMELVLRAGLPFASVPGDVRNIKLTTSHDWAQAQTLRQQLA